MTLTDIYNLEYMFEEKVTVMFLTIVVGIPGWRISSLQMS